MSEREFSSAEALLKIDKIIHSLNLNAVVRYTDHTQLVATADLFDNKNNLVDSGAGKGPDARVGALAESIEHFSTFLPKKDDTPAQRCDFLATQQDAESDGFMTGLPCKSETMDTYKLTTIDLTKELFVPRTLLHPLIEINSWNKASENTKFLSRYSSNSGVAFGCTKNEALLHGIHEIIERHILSRLFMAVCSIGPAIKLYTPSKTLLATALQNNTSALALAEKLQIIIIKDFMNVYFSVALPKSGPGDLHLSPIGSGCSLDICTAIQRAVTEQFQVDALYDHSQEIADRKTLDFLAGSTTLKNLIDLAPIKDLDSPVFDPPLKGLTKSVLQQLEILNNQVSATGRNIYYRIVTQYSDNGTVCQSYIPGLERFNIIRNGILVAPQRILRQTAKNS